MLGAAGREVGDHGLVEVLGERGWALFSGRRKSRSSAMTKRNATTRKQGQLERAQSALAGLHEEEREGRLEKSDVRLEAFGLLWVPVSRRI